MGYAKTIIVKPIAASVANNIVRSLHYSGKVDTRSQLHLGAFLDGKCGGAMQFGPSINKHASRCLVRDSGWNEWLELHRLAFAEWLPRNAESRAIAFALKWIRRTYPHIKWIVSYADATQSGDGAIYRASGFVLTAIKKNTSMWRMPTGEVVCSLVFNPGFQPNAGKRSIKAKYGKTGSAPASAFLRSIQATMLRGFQLRYIYFLDSTARTRLTVPIIPFSEIKARGASMYRGKSRAGSDTSDTSANHAEKGSSLLTPALPFN